MRPCCPRFLVGLQPADQPSLPLAAEGILRYVWESAYGAILIEVRDGVAYVNGERVMSLVELHEPALPT